MGHKKKAGSAEPRITLAKARNALGVIKVVGPSVVPVLAPLGVRAASALREAYDRYRAYTLGVDVASLPAYTGRGARLHARIAGLSREVAALRAETSVGDREIIAYADDAESTLRQLGSAVRAAERMPPTRRRAANNATARELDRLEDQLLRYLRIT